jgi:hypothetical protein
MWIVSLRLMMSAHAQTGSYGVMGLAASRDVASAQSMKNIQSLLDETTKLFLDMKASPAEQKKEKSIADAIQTDLLKLETELTNIEGKYATCIQEAYDEKLKYEKCKADCAALPQPVPDTHVVREVDSQSASSNSGSGPWLVIGIPTVGRPKNEDYLVRYVLFVYVS